MTHTEAVNLVGEIKERLSLLKDYVACKNEFNELMDKILIGDYAANMETVAQAVADDFNVSVKAMRGPGRQEVIVVPRQLAMFLTYKMSVQKISLQSIGNWYGERDHGTVIHAIKATENRLWANTRRIRERLARIEKKLEAL